MGRWRTQPNRTVRAARSTPDRRSATAGDGGFTLIELLVVVVIIGVLVAIAVPLYLNHRQSAKNATARADVNSAISSMEHWFASRATYPPSFTPTQAGQWVHLNVEDTKTKFVVSPGNWLGFRTEPTSYVICARNNDSNVLYVYNSASARPIEKSTTTTLDACLAAGN